MSGGNQRGEVVSRRCGNEETGMSHQTDTTKLLRDAANKLGRDRIREMLPPHMAIWISDHDTGCQIWIRLCDDPESSTVADICAWQGSIWYSSAYDFNDGFNHETDFAMGPIEEFFARVESAYVSASVNDIANREQQRQDADRTRAEIVAHFRELF